MINCIINSENKRKNRIKNSLKVNFVYHFANDEKIDYEKIDFFKSQPKGIINSLDNYILGFYGRKAVLAGMQNEVKTFDRDKLIPIELNIFSDIKYKDVYYDLKKIENSNFVDFTNLAQKTINQIVSILNIENDIKEYKDFSTFLGENTDYIFEIIKTIPAFKDIKIFSYQNILTNNDFIKVFALPLDFITNPNIEITNCFVNFKDENNKNYSLIHKFN